MHITSINRQTAIYRAVLDGFSTQHLHALNGWLIQRRLAAPLARAQHCCVQPDAPSHRRVPSDALPWLLRGVVPINVIAFLVSKCDLRLHSTLTQCFLAARPCVIDFFSLFFRRVFVIKEPESKVSFRVVPHRTTTTTPHRRCYASRR